MIDLTKLETFIREALQGSDYELITLTVDGEQNILLEVDRLQGVDVDFCGELNHKVCEYLDGEYGTDADYSLEVGSVSLSDPFKSRMQYEKNLGENVEVLAGDGKKYRGQLVSVDDDTFSVDIEEKVLVEGKKRPQKQLVTHTWQYSEVKYTKYDF